MSKIAVFSWTIVAASVIVSAAGCSKETTPATSGTATTETENETTTDVPQLEPPQTEPATLPTEGNPAAEPGVEGETAPPADQAMSPEIQAALASLSAEDRALAVKQKICPVSEEPLGAMGTPMKVSVGGQEVFVCCEHCIEPLKSDPAKHLAKIGLTPAGDAVPQ